MPLVNSFELSKKRGKRAWAIPNVDANTKRITFTIGTGDGNVPASSKVAKGQFRCIACGSLAPKNYIHEQFQLHKDAAQLMAVIAEGKNGRLFIAPDAEQIAAATVDRPDDYPTQAMNTSCTDLVSGRGYGFTEWHELFTNRQLVALTTFTDLLGELQEKIEHDGTGLLKDDDRSLAADGAGAKAYGQAISVYLAFLIDQVANHSSVACSWNAPNTQMRNTFGRQAIPMVWDYAECNIFSNSTGSFKNLFTRMLKAFDALPSSIEGEADQFDAQSDTGLRDIVISTDPPYYDNISYADLSDFFYIWLRRSMRSIYPQLYSTLLVPKAEELVATPYRFNSDIEARNFFEEGMYEAVSQMYLTARDDIPVTIYYAFKQGETTTVNEVEATASTGWETMLAAIIHAGFSITGTWPVRTEKQGRIIGNGTNALASSIVLVCRKRSKDAIAATRREFVNALKRELKPALDKLQTSNIAPVDLAQSAIGPGIGVYSRFSKVLEADGNEMTVRSALQIINQELDLYFTDQDSDLDRESRFCVDLYTQTAFNEIRFGEADVLARAKNTSIEGIAAKGAISSAKGFVRLLGRDEIRDMPAPDFCWLFTQQLTHAMETGGIEACAKMLKDIYDGRADNARALAYRLFTIADKKSWNQEAFAYNSLVVAWRDIESRAAQLKQETPVQTALDI